MKRRKNLTQALIKRLQTICSFEPNKKIEMKTFKQSRVHSPSFFINVLIAKKNKIPFISGTHLI